MPRGKTPGTKFGAKKVGKRQFKATGGQKETGFIQRTPALATAAMQGRGMPSTAPARTITRSDARKQLTKAPGKKVF